MNKKKGEKREKRKRECGRPSHREFQPIDEKKQRERRNSDQ
jgi:hypothetical protein